MTRTSHTHPLQVAYVELYPRFGRVGLTFCPGKKQPNAATGAWDRDLGLDLDALAEAGTAALVTLVEDHELRTLQVQALGAEVVRRSMDWVHAPIPDVTEPGEAFEVAWAQHGEGLRARLRSGFDVVVHCKGGLGRAGTVAARLLVELGWKPAAAVAAVREVRPGALETPGQVAHVMGLQVVPEAQPATTEAAIRDRAVGAMLGLAIGDAVGTTLEFKARDSYVPLTDVVGGGPFRLKPGEWTDDTAMSLALADSLIAKGQLDEQDLLARFTDWWRRGTYSCTGRCFDIGITTSAALRRWEATKADHCGSTSPNSAGNGSLMRLAPVAVRYWNDRPALRDAAARQSKTTHAAPEAVDACVACAEILADAIEGRPRTEVLRARGGEFAGGVNPILHGTWRGKARVAVRGSGYVLHSLEASLWAVGRTADYRSAVLQAANLGEDADTTAAITGQLAGALSGVSGLPGAWLERVAWAPRIRGTAEALVDAALAGA
jgi:ADP-ribosyl-[dinitrogen reductase] hydrolase